MHKQGKSVWLVRRICNQLIFCVKRGINPPVSHCSEHRVCIHSPGGAVRREGFHPYHPGQKGDAMTETKRTSAIQVRVTEQEKAKLTRIAQRYGLATSNYLRKVGLGGVVPTVQPGQLRELYVSIHEVSQRFCDQPTEETRAQLDSLANQVLSIYTDTSHGDNEDLAHQG